MRSAVCQCPVHDLKGSSGRSVEDFGGRSRPGCGQLAGDDFDGVTANDVRSRTAGATVDPSRPRMCIEQNVADAPSLEVSQSEWRRSVSSNSGRKALLQ